MSRMSDIHLETVEMLESGMEWESVRSHLQHTYSLSFAQAQGWMESVAGDMADEDAWDEAAADFEDSLEEIDDGQPDEAQEEVA